jgi:hypothetical protein
MPRNDVLLLRRMRLDFGASEKGQRFSGLGERPKQDKTMYLPYPTLCLQMTARNWCKKRGIHCHCPRCLTGDPAADCQAYYCSNHVARKDRHIPAQWGRERVIRLLLEGGADVNAEDEDDETAMHMACNGHEMVVRLLEKRVKALIFDRARLHSSVIDVNDHQYHSKL